MSCENELEWKLFIEGKIPREPFPFLADSKGDYLSFMDIFFAVLILLGLVGLSSLLNRFVPAIPIPLFQIGLGILIRMLPPYIEIPLDPKLFFVMFIAPLLFNDGKNAPRRELWKLRAPILLLALGLVFATVLVAGYYIHFRIQAIPVTAAFALAAILSPTDSVAFGALADRIRFSKRTMHLLEGESLMNDASGLVAFKFAVAASITGVFYLGQAALSFLLISIGGLVVGTVISIIVYRLRNWIRSLGMEDVTLLMLIQILTPFLIYLAAEEIGVSGILAVVAAGILNAIDIEHSPPHYRLRVTSENTWSVIVFLLNGLVFVILGIQLPDVAAVIIRDPAFSNIQALGYILEISVLLLLLRFAWVYLLYNVGRNNQSGMEEAPENRFKNSLLTTLAGVRGALTLAAAFSIPYVISSGNPFPERSLIIFIAAGVILFTLILASILLPILSKEALSMEEQAEQHQELSARIVLLKRAISITKEEITPENKQVALELITYYQERISSLAATNLAEKDYEESQVCMVGFKAERDETSHMLQEGEIDEHVAAMLFKLTDHAEHLLGYRATFHLTTIKLMIWQMMVMWCKPDQEVTLNTKLEQYRRAKLRTCQAAVRAIHKNMNTGNASVALKLISRYKKLMDRLDFSSGSALRQELKQHKKELRMKAVQAERDEVQSMFEKGSISRALANKLRKFINLMEASLLEEEPGST